MKRAVEGLMNTFKKRKTGRDESMAIEMETENNHVHETKETHTKGLPMFNLTKRNKKAAEKGMKSKMTAQSPNSNDQKMSNTSHQKRNSFFNPFNFLLPKKDKETGSRFSGLFGSQEDFNLNIPEMSWEQMSSQPSVFYFQDTIPEIIPEFSQIPTLSAGLKRKFDDSTIVQPPPMIGTPSTIIVTVMCARNLIATERGFKDASDPFVRITFGSQTFLSRVEKGTTDPQWQQTFSFMIDFNVQIGSTLGLNLCIFDHDDALDPEPIGKVDVAFSEAYYQSKSRNGNSDEISSWYPIKEGQGEIFLVYKVKEGLDLKFV